MVALALAFLAGVLTILSPCVLPLAPIMGPTRERVRAAMTAVGLLN